MICEHRGHWGVGRGYEGSEFGCVMDFWIFCQMGMLRRADRLLLSYRTMDIKTSPNLTLSLPHKLPQAFRSIDCFSLWLCQLLRLYAQRANSHTFLQLTLQLTHSSPSVLIRLAATTHGSLSLTVNGSRHSNSWTPTSGWHQELAETIMGHNDISTSGTQVAHSPRK